MQAAVAIASGWKVGTVRLDAWIAAERGRFAPWLAVFAIAGAALYLALRFEPAAWTGAAALLAGALAAWAARGAVLPRAAALAWTAGSLGFASAQLATVRALPIEPLPTRAAVLTGTVRGVDVLPEGRRLLLADVQLAADAAPLAREIRVRLRAGDPAEPAAGDRVRVRALLRPPASPAWPGGWDLQRDAFFAGLGGSGYALGPAELVDRAPPSGTARWWRAVRDGVAARAMAALPGTPGAIAATLLTGSTTAIPAADRAAFRDSGLAHLLAIAGLHIGIVMGLVMGATRFALALSERAALHWPTKAIAAVAALGAGGLYLLLTGGHVPILRSFAMACLVTLGLVMGRRAVSLRGLALAAVGVVLVTPQEVGGVSFQMSFSAVLALIAGFEALRPALARLRGDGGWRRRLASHVAALALTSALAGTASAPFAAYHFGHVQLFFVLANMVAVPLTALWVMPAGLVALALMPLGLERLAFVPMGWGIEATLGIGQRVAALPGAVLPVPHLTPWGLGAVALGLAGLGLWRTRLRLAGLLLLLLGLASPALDRAPDVLVSSDARLIAVRGPDGVRVQARSGASRFVRDAWMQLWAAGEARPFPAAGDGCGRDACRVALRGAEVLLLRRDTRPSGCEAAALLVSAEPARGACSPGVPVVDRFTVWRNGAHAIWLSPAGAAVLSDRAFRGARPWVPPPPVPHRPTSNLPAAELEPLPAE